MTIWNLLFYIDLEISLKIKLIWVPTHYYWSIPFSAVNSVFFFNFFTCMPVICNWGFKYTFVCNNYHLRFLSPYEYQSEVNFVRDQLWIQIYICVLPFEGPLHLQLQSHLCPTLDHVRQFDVDFSFCWLNLEVSWYSLEQEHLVEVLDELSSTTVDFFRSERELEYMCLYAV